MDSPLGLGSDLDLNFTLEELDDSVESYFDDDGYLAWLDDEVDLTFGFRYEVDDDDEDLLIEDTFKEPILLESQSALEDMELIEDMMNSLDAMNKAQDAARAAFDRVVPPPPPPPPSPTKTAPVHKPDEIFPVKKPKMLFSTKLFTDGYSANFSFPETKTKKAKKPKKPKKPKTPAPLSPETPAIRKKRPYTKRKAKAPTEKKSPKSTKPASIPQEEEKARADLDPPKLMCLYCLAHVYQNIIHCCKESQEAQQKK